MVERTILDDADDPGRAIRIGDAGGGDGTRWGFLLTLFMRIMAVFWLFQGLMQWHAVLTAQTPIFDVMPQSAAFAVIFFAVLDLVAGVGLWLATPWGGVLWLLIASAQIFVASSMPGFFAGGYWLVGLNLVLILLYFVLTFEAGRDLEAQRIVDRRRGRGDRRAAVIPTRAGWTQRAVDTLRGLFVRRRRPASEGEDFAAELEAAQQGGAHFQPRHAEPLHKKTGSQAAAPTANAPRQPRPGKAPPRGK